MIPCDPVRRLLLLAPMLLTISLLMEPGVAESSHTCRFGNNSYQVSETWYPQMSDQEGMFCTICACKQGGRLDCSGVACSQACGRGARRYGRCCSICQGSQRATTAPVTEKSAEAGSCTHNQLTYQDGERFRSNDTGLVPAANQCVQCICLNSAVRCNLRECPAPKCSNPVYRNESCCPVCSGRLTRLAGARRRNSSRRGPNASSVRVRDVTQLPPPADAADCVSADKRYPHGAAWHPMLGPFGRLPCQLCRCRSGRVICSRTKCGRPSCSRPRRVSGRCCPVCPRRAKGSRGRSNKSPAKKVQCVPRSRPILVWKSHAGANISQYIQYIFERPGRRDGDSEKHEWTFRHDTIQNFRSDRVTDANVADLKRVFHWTMLGTTNARRLAMFSRRERRVQRRCRSGCSRRVLRLERSLRLKPTRARRRCRQGEWKM